MKRTVKSLLISQKAKGLNKFFKYQKKSKIMEKSGGLYFMFHIQEAHFANRIYSTFEEDLTKEFFLFST